MKWENTTNEEVLQVARDEIWKSWRRACADNADHPRVAELFDPDKLPALVRSSVKAIAVACSSPSIRIVGKDKKFVSATQSLKVIVLSLLKCRSPIYSAFRPMRWAQLSMNHPSVDAILINDEIDFPSTATPASCGFGMLKRLLAAPFNAKAKPSILTM